MTARSIDIATARKWLDKGEAILIDVRTVAEHKSKKINDTLNMPVDVISLRGIDPQNKKILVHCQSGARGRSAVKKLRAEDTSADVYNLEGGIIAWEDAGHDVVHGKSSVLPLDRQVQLTIGSCVLLFSILAYAVDPLYAIGSGFFGAGLLNAGATGWCGLGILMAKMPWNK